MCELCLQTPCHRDCPNAPQPEPIMMCEWCGAEIYEGDVYFRLPNGKEVCEECIDDCRDVAEYYPPDDSYQEDVWEEKRQGIY